MKDRGDPPLRKKIVPKALSLQAAVRSLSGAEVLNHLLDLEDPGGAVRHLAPQDFFWIVKKVGEDDALPLLQLASEAQWQYVLDLGIWRKDRIALPEVSSWFFRLLKADPIGLASWLLGDGVDLASFYLQKVARVQVRDEAGEPAPDAFTLDGIYDIRVPDPGLRDGVEELLRSMAGEDYQRLLALLLGLHGVLPAELEEEMYRRRNIRLAEHGFLPYDEALSVFSPLPPAILKADGELSPEMVVADETVRAMVPILPLDLGGGESLLSEVTSRMTDPLFMDKMRLEFAGLCNQILSAEAVSVDALDPLVNACRKAAAYLNLALEACFGLDVSNAVCCLKTHPLVSVFRVGFGLALQVRWEAERWSAGSWFHRQGFPCAFWGETWGAQLSGLLETRPKFCAGTWGAGEPREFEHPSDLAESRELLARLQGLDLLLSGLSAGAGLKAQAMEGKEPLTFHALLFNFWARKRLGMDLSFSGIPLEGARRLLSALREGAKGPSQAMADHGEVFKDELTAPLAGWAPESLALLRDTLGLVWREFLGEYEGVEPDRLESRYSRFLRIL